jgi:DNA-binding MarR family transcriptional regulator
VVAEQKRSAEDDDGRNGAMRLVHLLRAVTVHLDLRGAEFARVNGLHATDVRALIHLLDAGRSGVAATPGWLGSQLGMNSAATTAVIDRLERAGHVRRERESADRRRVHLMVSAEAVALGWSFFGALIDGMLAAMEAFTDAELDTVARFLRAMAEVTAEDTRRPHSP